MLQASALANEGMDRARHVASMILADTSHEGFRMASINKIPRSNAMIAIYTAVAWNNPSADAAR